MLQGKENILLFNAGHLLNAHYNLQVTFKTSDIVQKMVFIFIFHTGELGILKNTMTSFYYYFFSHILYLHVKQRMTFMHVSNAHRKH